MNLSNLLKVDINFQVGWQALLRNKFRTLLTMLGIILGIFIVVTTVSLGGSIESFAVSEFENFSGTTMIWIGKRSRIKKQNKWVENPIKENLWLDDVDQIVRKCPSIKTAAAFNWVGSQTVTFGSKSRTYNITGVLDTNEKLFNFEFEYGRNFQPWEIKRGQKVCILGYKVKNHLFGDSNPVGQEIKIHQHRFTVIGSYKSMEKGLFRILGIGLDDGIDIPVTTVAQYWGKQNRWLAIMAKANSYETVNQSISQIKALFRQRFGADIYHDYGSPAEMIREISKIVTVIQWVLGGAAAITLIVGGIGTMNIMLVSVSERTAEIGLRKAVGANKNDIRFQFLIESVVICLLGGLIGTGLAGGVTFSVGQVITSFVIKDSVWPAAVSLQSAIVAFLVSTMVGVISGFYPSNKAAGLQPVEALRID